MKGYLLYEKCKERMIDSCFEEEFEKGEVYEKGGGIMFFINPLSVISSIDNSTFIVNKMLTNDKQLEKTGEIKKIVEIEVLDDSPCECYDREFFEKNKTREHADVLVYLSRKFRKIKVLSTEEYAKLCLNYAQKSMSPLRVAWHGEIQTGYGLKDKIDNVELSSDEENQTLLSSVDNAQILVNHDKTTVISWGNSPKIEASGFRAQIVAIKDKAEIKIENNCIDATALGNNSVIINKGNQCSIRTEGNNSLLISTGASNLIATGEDSVALANANVFSTWVKVTGKNSIAINLSQEGGVMGAIGSWLVQAEYGQNGSIETLKCAKVDGETIKENTFYRCYKGEFKEMIF